MFSPGRPLIYVLAAALLVGCSVGRDPSEYGDDLDDNSGSAGSPDGTDDSPPDSNSVDAGCRPTSCAAQGKTCGSIPDGCGGGLDCGECGRNYACSSDNVCRFKCRTDDQGEPVEIVLDGNVLINRTSTDDDLAQVEGVTRVTGNLIIVRTDLVNLESLECLNSIDGHLMIGEYEGGNDQLVSLAGLENLTSIGGSLFIRGNKRLIDISALDHLESIEGELKIYRNSALPTCAAEDLATRRGKICTCDPDVNCYCTGVCECTGNDADGVCPDVRRGYSGGT
jgi:hypothetical protein